VNALLSEKFCRSLTYFFAVADAIAGAWCGPARRERGSGRLARAQHFAVVRTQRFGNVRLLKVKFQLDFTAGIFIALL